MDKNYIIDKLKTELSLEDSWDIDGVHVFENNYIYVQYIEPHEGTDFVNMIRAEYIITFDRWSVSRYQETFVTKVGLDEIIDQLKKMMDVKNSEVKMDMLEPFLEDGNIYEVECPNGCYSVICDGGRNIDKKPIKFCPYCGADLYDRAYPLYEEE